MNSTLTITGLTEFERALAQLTGQIAQLAAAALEREAERIMTHAKQDYVPVDTGALRGSGQVAPADIAGTKVSVELGFGNAAVDYAMIVHETPPSRLGVRQALGEAYNDPLFGAAQRRLQNYAIGGRGWKYLERAIDDARAGMDARLGADVRRAIEDKVT